MLRVLLIRHGDYGLDGHLTLAGRGQADGVATGLKIFSVGVVYSSPQVRAMETARPLAALTGVSVRPFFDFDEADFGPDGLEWVESAAEPLARSLDTNESAAAVVDRVRRGLDAVVGLNAGTAGTAVAVFTHADVIKAAVLSALSAPPSSLLRLEIGLASVTSIVFGKDRALVEFVNQPAT